MKRVAPHVNCYCTFCKSEGKEKVRALWRISYDSSNRACDDHRPDLQKIEEERRKLDSHHSEADCQTWMRL
jgi:hypothetical protein